MIDFNHPDIPSDYDLTCIDKIELWKNKNALILSMASAKKGFNNKINAHKCVIVKPDSNLANEKLSQWHLYGAAKVSTEFLGLLYKDELVLVMGFSQYQESVFIFERSASKHYTTVIGGVSKLFKYFEKHYNPAKVYTYGVDLPFLSNRLNIILGFDEVKRVGKVILYAKSYI